ncbi:MAG: hypothetical protein DMF62_10790 [Acidobacteria bacterium]|nr:MAG: hypothetical protein DMF62_10790 [Acidobacteriota bacterium]
MNGKCIDIGTIQAFLDGETTQDDSLHIGHHVANCDNCARLLAVAEDENSFVFSTLDREMNALVPTQRLWTRINDSIEVGKARRPFWQNVYSFFAMSVRDRSMMAMAGLLIVFGLLAVVWTLQPAMVVTTYVAPTPAVRNTGTTAAPSSHEGTGVSEFKTDPSGIQPIRVSNHSPKKLEQIVGEANGPRVEHIIYAPGEESYIKTIADLKETVDYRKDEVFSGSSRVDFERDLAVVNDSIKRMQKIVRKNPNNQAARQILYASYQDKIDLLNTVAQKDELMATIR